MEIRVPLAEDRFRMRRPVRRPLFRVRRTRSPHAEARAKFRMLRKRQLHMIGNYTSFSSKDYATPCTCYAWHSQKAVITDGPLGYYRLYMHSTYESSTSLKGPKTRKRSLTWRPNTRHMALSALQLECVIHSSHDGSVLSGR